MIKNIKIINFRSLRNLEINNMKRITLISGRNNVGKSTILESLFLDMDHSSPDSFIKVNNFRSVGSSAMIYLWDSLFNDFEPKNDIRIEISGNENESVLIYSKDDNYIPSNISGLSEDTIANFRAATRQSYSIAFSFKQNDYQEQGHFFLDSNGSVLREIKTNLPGNEIKFLLPTRYLNSTYSRFGNTLLDDIGKIVLQGKKDEVIKVLNQIDPSIEDIVTLSVQGISQLYIRNGGNLIPLQYAGDGVVILLNICLSIIGNPNGLILIDEIESGLHYSMYHNLWKIIENLCEEYNCQLIATTHSYEMISAVRDQINNQDNFIYYRLGRERDGLKAYSFDYPHLIQALNSEMEVR